MRKFFAVCALVVGVCLGSSGGDWEILSLGITENVPSDTATSMVCGVKLGLPMCGGPAPVYGVEGAVFWAGTEKVDGIKCSLIASRGKEIGGLQLALLNFAEDVCGLQLGIFNSSNGRGLQIGLLNHMENSCVPWMPILNFNF